MRILVVGYWVWFGISIIVLSRRLIVRVTKGSKSGRVAGTTAGAAGPGAPDAPRDEAGDDALGDLASRVAARLATTTPETAPVVGPVRAPIVEPLVEPLARPVTTDTCAEPGDVEVRASAHEPTDDERAAALVGTVFASRLPQPTRSDVAGARTSLAEVLRGITMPAGLAPLVHLPGSDPERRVVFCTSGHPVEVVGAQRAHELARLGFALEPTSTTDAIARRGDDAIAVRMRTIGPQPPKGPADPAYPTAPAGSVVLDVELA
jgi:hypothetical protein